MNKREIDARCAELTRFWSRRNLKMKEWYKCIRLVNVLAQKDMESFISNDPRTFYNLALSLLNPGDIPHRIPVEGLDQPQITATSSLERLVEHGWMQLAARNRRRGRNDPVTELVELLLSTGWYSVFAMATEEQLIAEVWHPATVYPNWTDEGLVECVHIYSVTADQANHKCDANNWRKPSRGFQADKNELRDYWRMEISKGGEVRVFNAVSIGNAIPKRETEEDFPYIPIFIAPIGGLPDRGALTDLETWKGEVGEAIVATNLQVYENYNKQLTFLQQIMRDVATPKYFEQSTGEDVILTEEKLFKRGAIFRGGPEDKIAPLVSPPIPVELTNQMFTIQNMLQRGSLPFQLYGNLQETVSAYLLTQVASAARKILRSYHEGVIDVLTDIDNLWVEQVIEHKYHPWGFEIPQNLPPSYYMSAAYTVDIPGDLVLRATVARMMSPNFQMSAATTMDLLFPEIKDPEAEINRAIADAAMRHPVAMQVEMAQAYRERARQLTEEGQDELANLYAMAFQTVIQMLSQAAMAPPEEEAAGGSPLTRVLPGLGGTVTEGGS